MRKGSSEWSRTAMSVLNEGLSLNSSRGDELFFFFFANPPCCQDAAPSDLHHLETIKYVTCGKIFESDEATLEVNQWL
jgi:hypothetical protein